MNYRLGLRLIVLLILVAVVASAQKQISDDEIYDKVRLRLANDPDVKGGALHIEVKQGAVTLRGSVETEKQKAKAEKLAKKVNGVKKVNNELTIAVRGSR